MIPDWQLPPGVDRGLWDYLHSTEMVQGYDAQMAASPLAAMDVRFCETHFRPGSLLDLGCGTGRLGPPFAARGFACTGVDLSEAMLVQAAAAAPSNAKWINANIVEMTDFAANSFDNVACLFSTLGMVATPEHRRSVLANAFRLLKPGGVFVLHVHNRTFHGLGWRRLVQSDHTMPQAYGGAALTLHHFSKRGIVRLLSDAGFAIRTVQPVGLHANTPRSFAGWSVYGYLLAAVKP